MNGPKRVQAKASENLEEASEKMEVSPEPHQLRIQRKRLKIQGLPELLRLRNVICLL